MAQIRRINEHTYSYIDTHGHTGGSLTLSNAHTHTHVVCTHTHTEGKEKDRTHRKQMVRHTHNTHTDGQTVKIALSHSLCTYDAHSF
mmetsp:Transcript_19713/g.47777  ORF Transcript_19713/g.47777 Transcript_19713/m.47777 type:complete len:87 (-) Transcript_19713:2391-2651(-)